MEYIIVKSILPWHWNVLFVFNAYEVFHFIEKYEKIVFFCATSELAIFINICIKLYNFSNIFITYMVKIEPFPPSRNDLFICCHSHHFNCTDTYNFQLNIRKKFIIQLIELIH